LQQGPKRKGEAVELAFMLKAVSLGFGVAKPWGDSERYDFILGYRDAVVPGAGKVHKLDAPWRVLCECALQYQRDFNCLSDR
jgi:hypothetical protein